MANVTTDQSGGVQAGKCIVMCATQRTGSTLIFDDLRNVLGCAFRNGERLYMRIIREQTTERWESIWAEVSERNETADYIVNKVMFHYTPQISSFIAGQNVTRVQRFLDFRPDLFDAFHAFFRDAIWVYIERRDVFAQAVSMYRAESSGIWEIRPKAAADTERPELAYDGVRLRGYLKDFLTERTQWQRFFAHYDIEPLHIAYEDAVADYPGYLSPLLQAASLRMIEPVPARRLAKVGNDLNDRFADALRADVLAHPLASE